MTKTREKRPLRVMGGDGGPARDVKVAHVSDLHFTSKTDTSDAVWQALRQDIAAQHPDVIVATGDLVDNAVAECLPGKPRQALQRVRQYLIDLCNACAIDSAERLIVIPGNHDYRVQGNIVSSRLEKLFRSTFEKEFEHRLYPDLRLLILTFDSNTSGSRFDLATGAVQVEELLDVADARTELEKAGKEQAAAWDAAVKVALLHHHPMPIAATEGVKSLTEIESFLLLRNSGSFMTQMVKERVDVVLHGHRHCPSFSRATYDAGDGEHTVAVVSGGSVHHHELHDRSYNVVTVAATGEIRVQRRSLQANDYLLDREWVVRDYREARALRYERLLAERGGRLHAQRYSRHDVIQRDSGDGIITERFEEVTSRTGEPIPRMLSRTWSKSGYYGRVQYQPEGTQKISWQVENVHADGSRDAATTFNPPIGKSPISYSRSAVFANAIYFSRRDRLDATARESSEESILSSTVHAYDSMSLSVTFPPEHFPDRFRLVVFEPIGETKVPDYREQAFAEPHLTIIRPVHTVTFSVEHPLPGHEYRIVWDLPPEIEEKLSAKLSGEAAAIIEHVGAAGTTRLPQLVADLAKAFDPSVIVDLFVYDHGAGGQRPVASTDLDPRILQAPIVRSGVGPVGRADRRRAVIVTAPVSYGGPIPDLADELQPFLAPTKSLIAVPLYYPLYTGRRIGTVVLRTNKNASPLHGFCDDVASQLAVHDCVQSWYLAAIAELAQVTVDPSALPEVKPGNVAAFVAATQISEIAVSCRIAQHKPLSGSVASIVQHLSK